MWLLSNTVIHYIKKEHNIKFDTSKIFAPYLFDYFYSGNNMQSRKVAIEGLKSMAKSK